MSEDKAQLTATHGFNKFSHHWVKRDGPVWLRLVKAGQASDSELEQKLQEKALARKNKPVKEKDPEISRKPKAVTKRAPAKDQRVARKVNRSELDDLESDAAANICASY